MKKIKESIRIKEIENKWNGSIENFLYKWHWEDNLIHREIGKKLNVPRSTITRWFKKLGVPSQSCYRITRFNLLNIGPRKTPSARPKIRKIRPWKINEDFFNHWSSEMAYVLGFFCADGSMYKNPRGSHYIAFEITDRDLLLKIKNFIGVGHKLSLKKRTNANYNWKKSWSIQIGSKNIFNRLLKLGISLKKAHRIKMPTVPRQYIPDFIRGYFDGDGGVWCGLMHKKDRKNPTRVLVSTFTSCSKRMLQDIAYYLYTMAGTRLKNPTFQDGAFRLEYSTNDSRKIYRFIYHNKNNLFLNRKKIIFEKYLGA